MAEPPTTSPPAPAERDDDLMHIATPAEWDEAQRRGTVAPAGLATEGFVHCSTRRQVPGTLARHFAGAGPLMLLQLDPRAVEASLRWEGQPGEEFPHVYAAIPVEAVVAVTTITAPAR